MMSPSRAASVNAALAAATAHLRPYSDAPRADALRLLQATLDKSPAWIVAFGDEPLSSEDSAAFRRLYERRASGTPVAYLVGTVGFYGHEFVVDERVLVPRPESEHLVDEAIAYIGDRNADVLDVGIGSGALACSIAAATRATVYGTDISGDAIAVARQNARRFNLERRCFIAQGDLIEPFAGRRFDVVLANLPYVPTADLPPAPNPTAFEPRLALDGGADGLSLYRRLLTALPSALKPGAVVLLEAAPPTMPRLVATVQSAMPHSVVVVGKDHAGLDRYTKISCG